MENPFTHDFELIFDKTKITGEIEFNEDGKVSYDLTNSPRMKVEEVTLINQLFVIVQQLFLLKNGLEKIEIVKK